MNRFLLSETHVNTRSALWILLSLGAVACGGNKALEEFAGGWTGTIVGPGVNVTIGGEATWDDAEKLLSGQFTIQDPAPDVPHTYAIRRSEVSGKLVTLELTDVLDGTRGLNMSGEYEGEAFGGDGTVRYPCPTGTCGYQGVLSLTRGTPPPPPTGDTGQPPPPTGETGLIDTDTGRTRDTGPGDTGPGDTGPGDTGGTPTQPPEDTGP